MRPPPSSPSGFRRVRLFWAVITTIAFGLAAVSLLSGFMALLAARLLTAMIALFGVVVWLPLLIAHPHDHSSWAGNAQNALIGGAAWIVADLLARRARYAQPRRRERSTGVDRGAGLARAPPATERAARRRRRRAGCRCAASRGRERAARCSSRCSVARELVALATVTSQSRAVGAGSLRAARSARARARSISRPSPAGPGKPSAASPTSAR